MGTLEVRSDAGGAAVLILNHKDGSQIEYNISYEDEKTMLNGYQYYRNYDHDQCHQGIILLYRE
jgi:hypothetical protein